MSRWVIAIALSWSAWAVQQPAVAHARSQLSSELGAAMCGEGSQTVLLEELTLGRALSSAAAPIVLDEDAPVLRARAQQDDAPPAWCISPDDPRCAPRDQSAPLQGPRALVPMQDAAAMRWPELAAESGSSILRAEQLGAPKAGVGLRVERPPRCAC
jgi:hypothetical protein